MSEATTTPAPTTPASAPLSASGSVSASASGSASDPASPQGVAGTGPSRRTDIAVRTLQIVMALFLGVASAGPKIIGHSSAAQSFDEIGVGDWLMYLVGALELAGSIALVVPILAGVSAIAFMSLMIGAFVTQMTVFDGKNALTPVIFFVLFAVVAWVRRQKNAELLALVSRRV